MATAKKEDSLAMEDKLKAALVPEDEQPYQIPENWVWARLHSVVSINPPKKQVVDLVPETTVTFVPMAAVDDVGGEITAALQRPLLEVKTGFTQFTEGDVIFAKITPCMENGKAAIVKETINGIAYGSTEFFVLRPFGVDASLLHFFVRSKSFRNQAKQVMNGAVGQQRVPRSWMEHYPFPLPPLSEQQRIAEKLESLLCKVKEARALLDEIPEILQNFRQTVLAAAYSGRLTANCRETSSNSESAEEVLKRILEIRRQSSRKRKADGARRKYLEPAVFDSTDLPTLPDLWGWASADAICSQITDGEHIQPPYKPEGYPMLSAKHVRDGFVTLEGAGLISEQDFKKAIERCEPENEDILIVSVGATTGRSAIVERGPAFAIVRSVLLLKPLIPARFVLRWLQTPWCLNWMTQASGASAQPHLYIKDMKRMPVPFPPLSEQQEIIHRVESLFAKADDLEAQYKGALELIETLPEIILSKAFRGELVPQDPNDEPASELLNRTRNDGRNEMLKTPHKRVRA